MISVADLKTALRIDTLEDLYEEEAQAARLEDLEAAAVAAVERWTGRYFGPPEQSPTPAAYPGSGSAVLWLPDFASEVTTVSSRAYQGGEDTEILTDADDGWALRLQPGRTYGNQLVRSGGGAWDAGLEYVVTAAFGYDPGAEPPDIRQAVTMLVAHWWEQGVPTVPGNLAEVPFTVRDLLAPWKRWTA
jgi:uncharacterized phiE125 gp8 family phage protein